MADDTIVVGPGRNGDVNASGIIGDTVGEERLPASCQCVILVDKPLRLVSRDGASAMVNAANGFPDFAVAIRAEGVVFGAPNKGFTRRGAGRSGLASLANEVEVVSIRKAHSP